MAKSWYCGENKIAALDMEERLAAKGESNLLKMDSSGGVVCVNGASLELMDDDEVTGDEGGSRVVDRTYGPYKTELSKDGLSSTEVREVTMVDDEGEEFTRTERKPGPQRVIFDQSEQFYDRLDRLGGGGLMTNRETKSIDEAKNYINEVRAKGGGVENNPEYANLVAGIEGYFGVKIESYTSIDAAFNRMVDDVAEDGGSIMGALDQGRKFRMMPGFGGGGSGGGGTRYSYTEANEADVRLLANGLAEEMIGRRITEKEFDKLLKRVREEEGESPTISRSSGSTTRTETGITNSEREEVLAEVLRENPEWKKYQMDTASLDYTRDFIREQRTKANL
jgi:hypothetical protein